MTIHNAPQTYSPQQLKERAMRRLAVVLKEHAEEGRYPHSRIFETLVPDPWIVEGTSINGGGWREHVVPCSYLARECVQAFLDGGSVAQVAALLDRYLKIVHITLKERQHLDFELKLRNCMPNGWRFGVDDAFARLNAAQIAIAKPSAAAEPTRC